MEKLTAAELRAWIATGRKLIAQYRTMQTWAAKMTAATLEGLIDGIEEELDRRDRRKR
jgi:hypothetical protein